MTEARRRTSPLWRGLMAAAKARVANVSFDLGDASFSPFVSSLPLALPPVDPDVDEEDEEEELED